MTDTSTMIVVLGTGSDGKPRAGRFAETDIDLARTAAGVMGFHAVRVTEAPAKKVAAKLERAQIAADGSGTLPITDNETYGKLARLIGTKSEIKASQPSKPAAPPTAKAEDQGSGGAKSAADPWEAISVGSVVLCYDPGDQAWYEAVVLAFAGDKQSLTLRWRDYPGEPRLTALRDKVGLTRPRAS